MIKKITVFLLLLLIFFAASRSFFKSEFFYIHDFTQGARIVEMSNALKEGHFPVRWSGNFGYGYGMPLFEFYAPLPYYVGALFYLMGFSLINSIKILFLIPTLVTLIGGYKLGKFLFGRSWGLVVASAITLAPYRAVNLFVRGAVSELWGIMALSLILYGIVKITKSDTKNNRSKSNDWIILLISLLTLLLSHNLTVLIFLPLSILFAVVYLSLASSRKFFIKKIAILAGVYILAILISSFYWAPALLEKNYTKLESTILGNYFDYNLHFVYLKQFFQANWKYGGSSWGPYDDMSFYLGFGQLIAFGLSILLFFKHAVKFASKKSEDFSKKVFKIFDQKVILYLSSIFLFFLSIFMSMNKSKFIWDKIGFLSFIQFPWRWLSAAIVFLSLAIGFSAKFIKSKFHRYLFAGAIIIVVVFSNWTFFQPEKYLDDASTFYYSDTQKIRRDMSSTLPDFIPVQMMGDVLSPVVQEGKMLACELKFNEFIEIESYINEYGNIGVPESLNSCNFEFTKILNKGHKKIVEVNLLEETMLEFVVADFPGWIVEIDDVAVEHGVSEFGTILVSVKPGKHNIMLEFRSSKVRKIADMSSLIGLVILSSIYTWQYIKLRNN